MEEENINRITNKDVARVKEAFERNRTPREKRRVTIQEGHTTHKLTVNELSNYVEHNRGK